MPFYVVKSLLRQRVSLLSSKYLIQVFIVVNMFHDRPFSLVQFVV